jgi:hypothetical protein
VIFGGQGQVVYHREGIFNAQPERPGDSGTKRPGQNRDNAESRNFPKTIACAPSLLIAVVLEVTTLVISPRTPVSLAIFRLRSEPLPVIGAAISQSRVAAGTLGSHELLR